ncbi:MAG: site-2 protease family protein [Candidatus Jordarchaeaceae archaeon]
MPLSFEELRRIVERHFIVFEAYMELDGTPTFILPSSQETKIPFQNLMEELSKYDLIALLRKSEGFPQRYRIFTDYAPLEKEEPELVIKIFPNPEPKRTRHPIINILLLIATICTISYTGLQKVQSYNLSGFLYKNFTLYIWNTYGDPLVLISSFIGDLWGWYGDPAFTITVFTISLLAIIGLHEMGHYTISRVRGQKASLPFFIPGFPPIGTFGAVIFQRTPTLNRDRLFELGLMGPLTGFIITLIILVVSLYLTPFVYPPIVYYQAVFELQILSKYGSDIYYSLLNAGFPSVFLLPYSNPYKFPLLYETIVSLLRPTPIFTLMAIHPMSWAAWIGMLVTGLNLFPIGMLDAGHMARSFLSQKQQLIVSMVAAVSMVLISDAYLLMAFFALFTMSRGGHPGPLDDVSNIAKWKIAVFAIMMIIAVITIPPLGFGYFF